MKKKISLLISSVCLSATLPALAANGSSDISVLGVFAPPGVIGIYAGTETVSDAHRICIATIPSAEGGTTQFDGDSHDSYRECMAQYVPFKVSGADAAGACSSETVSWGECATTLPAQPSSSLFNAQNTINTSEFEGYANFICTDAKWEFVGGGCSSAVQSCEDGEIVEWGVTSPLWADDTKATPFIDRFGVERHTPKGSCYASMPEALSGQLLYPKPTNPETTLTVGNSPGNISSSSSQPSRCFDKEWIKEDTGNASCDYIPLSCASKKYTNSTGCEFDLPNGSHDDVYSANKPSGPTNSVGGIQAHCWDGEWEIKSTSCALSCSPSVASNVWSSGISGVNRSCQHDGIAYSERLSPGHNLLIDNQTEGMIGSTSYTCDNGTLVKNSESCAPKGCEGLPSNMWVSGGNACSHPSIVGSYQHGQEIKQYVGDIFSETYGEITYQCKFGNFEVSGTPSCETNNVDVSICDATGETACPEDGMVYDNGICCFSSNGNGTCTTNGL